MFKHILFPTDGSTASFAALPQAVDIARHYNGKITILNVHEEFLDRDERIYLRVSAENFKEMMAGRARKAREAIEIEMAKQSSGVEHEILIREGTPRDRICEIADELGCDLLVMATHGRSGVQAFVLGSVTDYVIKHTGKPVLVVHA